MYAFHKTILAPGCVVAVGGVLVYALGEQFPLRLALLSWDWA
jgi:hypothetical protein